MSQFDDRKRDFESKFAHDQELQFKAVARRNKLIGLWAAERLGKSGEDADAYAMEVVRASFAAPGDDGVVQKLVADLGERADEATVRAKLDEMLSVAKEQIATATG